MDTPTRIFLKKKFKEYYFKHKIPAPLEVEKREFGIGTLEKKIAVRHLSFRDEKDLQNYLKKEAPFYISYSSAYYEFPDRQPMAEKNWMGADLVFDLDVEMELLNRKNLEKVKEEALNLIDFISLDFGLSKKDIEINFSGGKGYHIRVVDKKIKNLGGEERRGIIDYVTGSGLDITHFMEGERVEGSTLDRVGSYSRAAGIIKGPTKGSYGWAKRIYNSAFKFLNSSQEELEKFEGIGPRKAEQIFNDRGKNLDALEKGLWRGFISFTPQLQKRLIQETAVQLTGDTDRMVTIDTSRIMRLPGSIHGGTGLIARKIKDLEEFDPLREACAFGENPVEIELAEKIPKFDFPERIGPFSGRVKVPEYVAVYLLLKGKGEIVK